MIALHRKLRGGRWVQLFDRASLDMLDKARAGDTVHVVKDEDLLSMDSLFFAIDQQLKEGKFKQL